MGRIAPNIVVNNAIGETRQEAVYLLQYGSWTAGLTLSAVTFELISAQINTD